MRAMVIREFGGPEVFEEATVGEPEVGPNDVLVEVHATSINPVDLGVRRNGQWAGVKPPAVIGYDASGVVRAVGDGVSRFAVGDEVYYTPAIVGQASGTDAEFHSVPESVVAHRPANLSHAESASIPLVGTTAWDGLVEKAKLRVGESILIHGAGGVGSVAIQLAKAMGAYVIVVCSDYMVDLAKQLGADRAVNYKTEDFLPAVQEATDGYGVDVVFDTVGDDTMTRSVDVTKVLGRIVGIAGTSVDTHRAQRKNISIFPTFLQQAAYKLDALRVLIERGEIKPVIDSVLPLDQIGEAHRRLEKGGVRGKIVLSIRDP
jgi:NADPH:quinone reductase